MSWQNFRQLKGQSVQEYTQEFRNRAWLLGVNLNSQDTLLKYIGEIGRASCRERVSSPV